MMHFFSIARTPNERTSVLEHAGVPLFQMREETLTQVRGSNPGAKIRWQPESRSVATA